MHTRYYRDNFDLLAFIRATLWIALLLLALFLGACTKSADVTIQEEEAFTPAVNVDFPYVGLESKVDARGLARVSFVIPERITAIQLVTDTSEQGKLRLLELKGPQGVVWSVNNIRDSKLSFAGNSANPPNTFNFPIVADSPELVTGNYQATYETEGMKAGSVLRSTLITKTDDDLNSGIVDVDFVLCGAISQSDETVKAVKASVKIVQQILARGGLTLNVVLRKRPELPNRLPDPSKGDVLYEELGNQFGPGVHVYFASDAIMQHRFERDSSEVGSIPGPFIPSRKSAVTIDIGEAAGNDGLFDAKGEEVDRDQGPEHRIFSEFIAQGILHYLGLPISVVPSGNFISFSDGLDSPKCITQRECENDADSRINIMFPYPVRKRGRNVRGTDYYPRDQISSGQRQVINRYVGVN
ncbi:MAG: hypothetical protein D6719_10680 [Candidatus Dadabacteria bacterium]|nr:MAG: hypothetical protein D6719_10680 [Candidatus Dadabacteria bacterium]